MSESVKQGLCRAPSCAGVSLTVAMAVSHQSCADDSETVAKALPRQSCADGSYGCAAPKLCGRFRDGSYGFAALKLCRRIETYSNDVGFEPFGARWKRLLRASWDLYYLSLRPTNPRIWYKAVFKVGPVAGPKPTRVRQGQKYLRPRWHSPFWGASGAR